MANLLIFWCAQQDSKLRHPDLNRPHQTTDSIVIANERSQRGIGCGLGVSQATRYRLSKQSEICALVRAEEKSYFCKQKRYWEEYRMTDDSWQNDRGQGKKNS
jgi:hypothetical protein